MSRLRDIKRRARGDLHREASVPALYIAIPGANPVEITVRVHTKFDTLGGLPGSGSQYAEREEIKPRILFLVEEIPQPRTNAIVSVEEGEAYRVVTTQPRDGMTISAEVVQLSAAETANLPTPELTS